MFSVAGKINISYEIMPVRLGVCVYGKSVCLQVNKVRKGEKARERERERTF